MQTKKAKIKKTNKKQQSKTPWYILLVLILFYALLFILKPETFTASFTFFSDLIIKVIPIFILVFILMALTNYYITPEFIIKHLNDRGIKKWLYMIIGGMLSSGPIYMWFPLLEELKDKGMNYGLMSCFLYNRSIKLPVLPLAIIYFNWQYIIILTIVMVIISVVQGKVINKIMSY